MNADDVTGLLLAWGRGDQAAFERLVPIVHAELHRIAMRCMSDERAGHSLQATALVNEAYMRLVDWKDVQWQNRAHFFGLAAQAMRHILVDEARSRLRASSTRMCRIACAASPKKCARFCQCTSFQSTSRI